MKKLLLVLALITFTSVYAADFGFTDDAEIPSWATEAIEELMDQGVISGNDDGSFRPNEPLNRAEVAKIIVLASGVDFDTSGGPHFPDVQPEDWYYDYVETMYNAGWINGYPDGLFRPGNTINRAEIAKMVVEAFEIDEDLYGAPHFDDVGEEDWFFGYVETAYNNGLMRGYGDGNFKPENILTRAEIAKIAYDGQIVSDPYYRYGGCNGGTIEILPPNSSISSKKTPINSKILLFDFGLNNSDVSCAPSEVEVSAIKFSLKGFSLDSEIKKLWIEINDKKQEASEVKFVNDNVEFRFYDPPILLIPSGFKYRISFYAEFDPTYKTEIFSSKKQIILKSPADLVTTSENIMGKFPIEGPEIEIVDPATLKVPEN